MNNSQHLHRILITTGIFPPDIGGPASYSKVLAEKISAGIPVCLITYSSVRSSPNDKSLPYPVIRVWKKIPRFLRHAIFFQKVFSNARKADIIFALNLVSAGVPSLVAAKMFKKKLFVKVVGDYAWEIAVNNGKTSFLINDFQDSAKRGWIKILHRFQVWVCKNADGIIVPSEYLKKIVSGWGIAPEKIKVIYNEVDFKSSELTKEEARKKIAIPGSLIVSIGRLVPWKGFRLLIKVMPDLLRTNQYFRLIIIGDGPERKNLEAMVRNMGLEKKVYIVGKKSQEDIAVYLAASDMFVLNTGYEGFSHQILEVMSAGVPVVTTSVGGNKEIMHQGENGFMIRYNDQFNLIEAIKGLWASPELREKFIEGGKRTAGLFSVDSMYEDTIEFLAKS